METHCLSLAAVRSRGRTLKLRTRESARERLHRYPDCSTRLMHAARILVVDDHLTTRQALGTILRQEGYEVREASAAEEALDLLRAFEPNLILSDLHMPRIDGATFLEMARESGCSASFVLMTSLTHEEVAAAAMRSGAAQCLHKPLDIDVLLGVVQQELQRTRATQ